MDFKKLSELTYEIDGLMLLIDRHQEETPREAIDCLRNKLREILAVIDSEEVEADTLPSVTTAVPIAMPTTAGGQGQRDEDNDGENDSDSDAETDNVSADTEEQKESIRFSDTDTEENDQPAATGTEAEIEPTVILNDEEDDNIFFTEEIADDTEDGDNETVFYEEVTTAGFFDDETVDYKPLEPADSDSDDSSDKIFSFNDPEESDDSDRFVSEAIRVDYNDAPEPNPETAAETACAAEFEEAADADIDEDPVCLPGDFKPENESVSEEITDEEIAESAEDEQTEDACPENVNTVSGSSKPFTDIARAFTINDKFRFRRELFGNSDAEYVETIDMLSAMTSLDEIEEYLFDDLSWDRDNEDVKAFLEVITNYIGMRHGG